MSDPVIWLYLFGVPVSAYAVLLVLFVFVCGILMHRQASKRGLKRNTVVIFLLCAVPLSLIMARSIYCAVRYEWIFLDEMGEFGGLMPFFDISIGGFNVIGALLGCLLAGFLCAIVTKQKAGAILDSAAPAGVLLIALSRFIEPLSGQGYGDMIIAPAFQFYPVGLQSEWGDWFLAVCNIEGLLALVLFFVLWLSSKKTRRSGTLTLYFIVLFCASQIMPQSLRSDDVLFILIFARVTQIGYMVFLCGAVASAGVHAVKHGGFTRRLLIEWLLILFGVGISIAAEFALDKTNLPDLLVYTVMIAALAGMASLGCMRIQKEDIV